MVRYPALIEEIPEQSEYAGLLFDDVLWDYVDEQKKKV